VAASVASLFAIYLRKNEIEEGEILQAMVFLTIATTVLVQGLTAGFVARRLGLAAGAFGVVIVGANRIGRLLGRLLRDHGREVALIDTNPRNCRRANRAGLPAFAGNSLEVDNLERIGVRAADCLVALTPNNGVNYLVSRLALEEFRIPRALALITAEDETVDAALRRDPPLFTAEVAEGAPDRLEKLQAGTAIPLIRIRGGRAEPCGDGTTLAAGDTIVFLHEPGGTGLTKVRAGTVPPKG
jgi:hypothetical protein